MATRCFGLSWGRIEEVIRMMEGAERPLRVLRFCEEKACRNCAQTDEMRVLAVRAADLGYDEVAKWAQERVDRA